MMSTRHAPTPLPPPQGLATIRSFRVEGVLLSRLAALVDANSVMQARRS